MGKEKVQVNDDWLLIEMDTGELHVVPRGQGHEFKPECWCEPEITYKDARNGKCVWTHRELQ